MKRLLTACLGMVLVGIAGLLIVHQFVDRPSAGRGQPPGGNQGGGRPLFGGEGGAPAEPGQFKEIVAPLLAALADSDGNVRQLAAASLIKIGPDAVAPLTEALKAKDLETRANAAYVLGHLKPTPREALPALAKALKDEDKEVRVRAAFAIHSIVSRVEASGRSDDDLLGAGGGPARPATPGGTMPMGRMSVTPLDPGLLVPEVKPTLPKPEPAKPPLPKPPLPKPQ
jgi:hypothetical protein